MRARTLLKLHNLKDGSILDVENEAEACMAIIDLKLADDQWLVIEQTIESEIVDFTQTLSMFKNKKKQANKKPDVEGEGKAPPIEIIGEVIG